MTDDNESKFAKAVDREFKREHPSYGMLQISRITGGTGECRLFGSPLATHYGTIRISIGKGTWMHELNHDRYYGSLRGEHIEIEMSAAQFAEAITTLNHGSGTPCTIRHINGKRIEDPPEYATEAEHIRENFTSTLGRYSDKIREYRKKIEAHTNKLGAKAREEIRVALDVIEDQIASNVPFVVKMFQEATTRITTAAKTEVDAFVTNMIHRAGLTAIASGFKPLLGPAAPPRAYDINADCPDCGNHAGDECFCGPCPACHSTEEQCIAQCPNAGSPRRVHPIPEDAW